MGNGGGAVLEVSLFFSMIQGAAAEGNSDLNEYKVTAVPLVVLFSYHNDGNRSNMSVRRSETYNMSPGLGL